MLSHVISFLFGEESQMTTDYFQFVLYKYTYVNHIITFNSYCVSLIIPGLLETRCLYKFPRTTDSIATVKDLNWTESIICTQDTSAEGSIPG